MRAPRDAGAPTSARAIEHPAKDQSAILRQVLVVVLLYSIGTLWVREGWALRALQLAAFSCAAVLACRVAAKRLRVANGLFLVPFIGMFLWGVVQLAAHWTVVQADTEDAVLYWLTACSMAWLGHQACLGAEERRGFLKAALTAGSAVALLGILQLFSSPGRVFWLFESGYTTHVIGPFVSPNNYAAFIELLVPVAITLALESREKAPLYLAVAAALLASVVASGSRAGTILVIAESAAAFLLYHPAQQCGRTSAFRGRLLLNFAVLASVFTAIVGYEYLWMRFLHTADPYFFRRELLPSSVAMFRAEPMHGFGLGAWASAYPQFATIDIGAIANHAHNEWIQWAAEGGWPALALMLAAVLGVARPAIRSVWGIGVLAVSIHALVDYPFLRLGLAAWIFAFWGAVAACGRRPSIATPPGETTPRQTGMPARILASATVLVLVWGIYSAVEWGWADHLFRRATPGSLRRAIGLRPHRAEYQLALAEVEPNNEVALLKRAIVLNPYFTQARIRLALQTEMRGQFAESERQVLEATLRDRQFLPAWTAANFYFRQNRQEEFWHWARAAAEMSHDDIRSLFDLCFRLTNDGSVVLERVVGHKRSVERKYLGYLIAKGRLPDAHALAERIAARPETADRDPLFAYIDAALAGGQAASAYRIWEALGRARLLPEPSSDASLLANGDFAHRILSRAFDWRVPAISGVETRRSEEGTPTLHVAFSGKQPESCELLRHALAMKKGGLYVLRFQYRTSELPPKTGLHWSFDDGREYALDASEEWQSAEWPFEAFDQAEYLSLKYRRLVGSVRIEGSIALRHVFIAPITADR